MFINYLHDIDSCDLIIIEGQVKYSGKHDPSTVSKWVTKLRKPQGST